MCGIVGLYSRRGLISRDSLAGELEVMSQTLYHRGPDSAGTWLDPDVPLGLGHRRLSILDLSAEGAQPMVSASGRYVISYNGEIYNYREIRDRLSQSGHTFRGTSDTEVLLAAFDEWGIEATIPLCNGMFALGAWDCVSKTLTLVRDRLGVKPLYYGWNRGSFFFASEVKAIERSQLADLTVDSEAISLFMRYNYIVAPWSIFDGIYKLLPGSLLSLPEVALANRPDNFSPHDQNYPSISGGCVSPHRYWSLPAVAAQGVQARKSSRLADDYLDELHDILVDAVRLRMISDVPLGAFLSGGIDSSLVVAVMQRLSSQPITTFTIGVADPRFDEAPYARAVAAALGTNHIEHTISPDDALAVIPLLPSLFDEPFSDSSQIPTFLVSQLARKHVTVSLSGDGGDEFFAGYTNRYLHVQGLWNRLAYLPRPLKPTVASFLESVPATAWDQVDIALRRLLPRQQAPKLLARKMAKLARTLRRNDPNWLYTEVLAQWDPADVMTAPNLPRTMLTDPTLWPPMEHLLDRMMLVDQTTYLTDDVLVKVDRASMGVSLEAREPLLDVRFVEAAWRLPLSLKVNGGVTKVALRRLLGRYVPSALFERPKRGFSVPIDQWLRGPLREWAEDLLDEREMEADGYFKSEVVRTTWEAHLRGTHDWHHLLWNVLMFQAWCRSRRERRRAR